MWTIEPQRSTDNVRSPKYAGKGYRWSTIALTAASALINEIDAKLKTFSSSSTTSIISGSYRWEDDNEIVESGVVRLLPLIEMKCKIKAPISASTFTM